MLVTCITRCLFPQWQKKQFCLFYCFVQQKFGSGFDFVLIDKNFIFEDSEKYFAL